MNTKQTETEQAAIKVRSQFLTQCVRCNPHAQADYMPEVPDNKARAMGLHGATMPPKMAEAVFAHMEAHPADWAAMLRIFLLAAGGRQVSGDARHFVIELANKISGVEP
jgi:hypothetical protein